MKKKSLFVLLVTLVVTSFYSTCVLAQKKSNDLEFKFEKQVSIKEIYPEKDQSSDFHKIKVVIKRDSIPAFDFGFTVQLKHITTSVKDVKLLTEHFAISKDDFHKGGHEIERFIVLEVLRDTTEVDKSDEVFELTLIPDTVKLKTAGFSLKGERNIVVSLIDAPKPEDSESPYRITTGANFDFDKTLKASLYFDAQVYKPIALTPCKSENYGFGIYASLYNNRYISSDSLQDRKVFYDAIGTGDTVDLVRYNYELGASNSIKNIGAEISLLYSITYNPSKDLRYDLSFLLPEFSTLTRTIKTDYSYEKINQDTLFNVPRPDTLVRLVEREFTVARLNEFNLGTGIIFRMKSKKHGEFMLKASTGLNWTYFPDLVAQRGYYNFRFQLLDAKVGINLGGEIRGYYKHNLPYFGVYLSKSFSLAKLTEY